MRLKLKALLLLILAAAMLCTPCGCMSARDLNELIIVMGIGIDQDDQNPEDIKLIAQIVLPGKISTPGGGGASSGEDPYYNLSSSARGTFEAVREYTHMVSGKLYTAHAQVIVIGRELAEQGISSHLDFFVRANEIRPTTKIVISDTTSDEVLGLTPKMNQLPATNISKLIETQTANSQSEKVMLLDYINAMQSPTTSFMAPIVAVTEREGEQVVAVSGMAVFKEDKMVGQLSERETRGVLWVRGEVKSTVINVNIAGGVAALEVLGAQSDVTPVVSDGSVTMKISVSLTVSLAEQTCKENLATQDNIKALQALAQDAICDEIGAAYQKAAELRTDVFGFGELVHKHQSQYWHDIEPRWDELFRELTLEISVDAAVKAVGGVEEPVWYKDEEQP